VKVGLGSSLQKKRALSFFLGFDLTALGRGSWCPLSEEVWGRGVE
jgi:hypothetical protein